MDNVVSLLTHYGLVAVFVAVFLDELGLPSASPVVVMTAAAYSSGEPLTLVGVLMAALAGGMLADFVWFLAARKHGGRLLAFACRFSSSPDSCVQKTNGLYGKYGNLSLVASKFIPGTGIIAIALAGAADLNMAIFAGFTGSGLLALHASFLILGVVFHSAVHQILTMLSDLGPYSLALLMAAVLGYIAFRWLRYRAFVKSLKMARISVQELVGLERNPIKWTPLFG